MGNKVIWIGMSLLLAVPALGGVAGAELAGAVFLIVGTILLVLDK